MREYDCKIFRAESWRDSERTEKEIRAWLTGAAKLGACVTSFETRVSAAGELVIFILLEREPASGFRYTHIGLEEIADAPA